MKTRLLVIISLIVLLVGLLFVGFFLYQQQYDKNCIDDGNRVTGFLRCTGFHCDFGVPLGTVGIFILKGSFNQEKNLNIHPETIALELGVNNTVMWINHDRESMVFTANDGSWTTGEIFSCTSKKTTFNQTGIFEYSSESYPWLNGTIIVGDKNKTKCIYCEREKNDHITIGFFSQN